MKNLIIRKETENDYVAVEHMIREAFWNVYAPGCDEHYMVHVMRKHEDFIPELALVAELNGEIVGNVMYTKTKLVDEAGNEKSILSFGPIGVLPKVQRKGIGKAMLEYSFERAVELGYDAVVIYGNPANYVARGMKSCKRYNICNENGVFKASMLVKELKQDVFDGRKWFYHESAALNIDEKEVKKFDAQFEPKEKKFMPSQEEFFILSNAEIRQ